MENDEFYQIDEVKILINPDDKEFLEGNITIDHKQNYGFLLKNDFEILAFGMRIKKR